MVRGDFLRSYIRRRRRDGWRFSKAVTNGRGHLVIEVQVGELLVRWTIPKTPSDRRADQNSIAQLERMIGREGGGIVWTGSR